MQTTRFLDMDCVSLENSSLSLLVTQSVGPRIISLRVRGGENLLAVHPNETLDCPGVGKFHFYGGHRLWHAPENSVRTYLPDDQPVKIEAVRNGLQVSQQVEGQTGIEKSMLITLPDNSPRVIIQHTLTNRGLWPVECAPWAITQFRTGGIGILPQATQDTGLLPNRSLAVWPYTDIKSAHFQWGNRYIFINAAMEAGQLKLGFPNPRGWLAYWLKGTLFVKQAAFNPEAKYYDFDSSSECYCDPRFLELETLGPIETIPVNGSATHTETWEVFEDVDLLPDESVVQELIERLGIGRD